jgi:hypothetical protein
MPVIFCKMQWKYKDHYDSNTRSREIMQAPMMPVFSFSLERMITVS